MDRPAEQVDRDPGEWHVAGPVGAAGHTLVELAEDDRWAEYDGLAVLHILVAEHILNAGMRAADMWSVDEVVQAEPVAGPGPRTNISCTWSSTNSDYPL